MKIKKQLLSIILFTNMLVININNTNKCFSIKDDNSNINLSQENKNELLIIASWDGNIEFVESLLNSKYLDLNINYIDKYGYSALIIAVIKKNIKLAKLLLNNNADVNICNINGGNGLISASLGNDIEMVKLLIEKNIEINKQDNYGDTALIWAAINGSKEIINLLLNHGADPKLKNNNQETALDKAIQYSNYEIASILRRYFNNNK